MTQLPFVTVVACAEGVAAVAAERAVARVAVVVEVTGAFVASEVVGAVAVVVAVVVMGALSASQPVMMTTPDAPAAPLMRRARCAG